MSNRIEPPTDADYALAKQVAEWIETLDGQSGLNDYLHNIMVYGRAGIVTMKGAGIMASAINAFQKEQNKLATVARRAKPGENSKHVGAEGDKIMLKVTLIFVKDISSEMYPKVLHKFVDESGNILTWFGSKQLENIDSTVDALPYLPLNTTVWIKATVKRHGDYEGVKETHIQRVQIVDDPETAARKKLEATAAKKQATTAVKAARKAFGTSKVITEWEEREWTRYDHETNQTIYTTLVNGRKARVLQLAENEFGVEQGMMKDDNYTWKLFKTTYSNFEEADRMANNNCFSGGQLFKVETK